ncbi:MAG TPA: hypothetical protein VG734_12620 [Lacunisphaera sp.]|nr:hypothetical protein [Lacunisphaera sp.]
MNTSATARGIGPLHARLDDLRTELADLAFDLERRGRRDAADVVMLIDGRVREMADEIAAGEAALSDRAACPTSLSS